MNRSELLGSRQTHEILAYFAKKLGVSCANERAVFEAVEEWWFVPRSTDAVRASHERVTKALELFRTTGRIAPDYEHAYRFAVSDRNLMLEEKLSRAHAIQRAA